MVRPNQRHFLSWFLFGLSAGSALAAAIWFEVVHGPFPTVAQQEAFTAVFEANRHPGSTDKKANEASRKPHLVFQNSIGAINDPLPLRIVLNNSSGGETLVLSDLAEGTKLSAGAALSSTRWSVPERDLNKAFIAAPENFSGSMQVTAKLYSSDNLVLETKNIRFEWAGSQTKDRPASIDLADAAPAPDLAADGNDAIRFSNGSGLDRETDARSTGYSEPTARWWGLLRRDHHPFGQKPLAQPSTSPPARPAALLERAERLLREGDVAAARPLLKRAADAGNADAAVDLGISFDPSFVPHGNSGADPVQAARWYKRALKLGRKYVAADLERVTNMSRTAPR